jgi:hypothetical protein
MLDSAYVIERLRSLLRRAERDIAASKARYDPNALSTADLPGRIEALRRYSDQINTALTDLKGQPSKAVLAEAGRLATHLEVALAAMRVEV